MYSIVMETRTGNLVALPDDKNLKLFEACHRADIYSAKNHDVVFSVISNDTGEIMYQV